MSEQTKTDSPMTPIEQAKEALQEVSDTMDRKGGVAPIIRLDTLKKVNAALSILKTMEGEEPVAWMNKAGQVISGSQKNTHKDRWERRGNNKSMNIASEYLTPLYTHTKTITVDEERTFTESEVRAMMDDVKAIAADHSMKCYTNRINQMTPPAPVAFHIDNYLWKSHGLFSDPA